MKSSAAACSATALLVLMSCAGQRNPGKAPAPGLRGQLTLDDQADLMQELTAGTWTVISQKTNAAVPQGERSKAAMLSAIEKTSGCRVSDSDYSPDGSQLDAQLDCERR